MEREGRGEAGGGGGTWTGRGEGSAVSATPPVNNSTLQRGRRLRAKGSLPVSQGHPHLLASPPLFRSVRLSSWERPWSATAKGRAAALVAVNR